ncbi:MAG: c-type cytochrome [Polyangiales bacterium]
MLLRTSLALPLALSVSVVFAACGGGGGGTPPTTPTAAASEAPSAAPETKTEPAASAAPAASSAAPAAPAPDSAAQVAAGEKAYNTACAMCHGKKGEGKGKNPALVGAKALDDQHNGKELFDYIKTNMPPKKPGSLSDDDTWAVTAWLLDKNGLLNGKGLNAATGTTVTWKR